MPERITTLPINMDSPPLSPLSHEVSFSHESPIITYSHGIKPPELRFYSEQELETSEHELNHTLAGSFYNNTPELLSIEREGNSLGRTVFSGDVAPPVIAAGAVETSFGEAKGYGSDIGHFRRLFPHKTEQELNVIIADSISKARTAINHMVPDSEVRKRAAVIIASMKNVAGELIPEIIRVAELEVMHGITTSAPKVKEIFERNRETQAYKDARNSGKITVIDIGENNTSRVKVIALDTNKEKIQCLKCRVKGGHEISCVDIAETIRFAPSGDIVDLTKDVPVAA